jgi:hypothetical protein
MPLLDCAAATGAAIGYVEAVASSDKNGAEIITVTAKDRELILRKYFIYSSPSLDYSE